MENKIIENQPRLYPNPVMKEYTLLRDFRIEVLGESICIPQGYSYDGASIPRLAWAIITTPFDPSVMLPALCHDYLYLNHQVNKETADKIFHQLLLDNGVGEKTATVMYNAVKFFGGNAYKNNDKDIEYLKQLYIITKARTDVLDKYKFPKEIIEELEASK